MTTEQKIRQVLSQNPTWGRFKVAKQLGMSPNTVGPIMRAVRQDVAPTGAKQPVQSFEESGDTATATTLHPNVRTLDDLLAFMKVDLSVWEVEKYTINKWEVAMREPATTVGGAGDKAEISRSKDGAKSTLWTRGSNVPLHEPLFQVKAWLKRKNPEVRSIEKLLERLEKGRFPKPLAKRSGSIRKSDEPKRSLEICLMDVHMGLICQQPEADAKWDLDIAAQTVLTGLEDLLTLTSDFGPFHEIFLPFGNDFSHIDNVFATTTAGTGQPEAASWHRMYLAAEELAINVIERLRKESPQLKIYEIPGNHSRMTDFTLARLLRAYFRNCPDVFVDASPSPYKFHRCGVNLIGYEHGHSVKPSQYAGLMANERPKDWAETHFREYHIGDKHRKGTVLFEEQGVSVEYVPGITAGNEWHRLKAFNHCTRGAVAFVWDWKKGPVFRCQHSISQYTNSAMK